jgi:hypothetical protein
MDGSMDGEMENLWAVTVGQAYTSEDLPGSTPVSC